MDPWHIVAALATAVATLAALAWKAQVARLKDHTREIRQLREDLAAVSSDRDSYRTEAREATEQLAGREAQLAEFHRAEAERAQRDLRTLSGLIGLTPDQIRQLATNHDESSRRARARATELDRRE